MTNFKTGPYQSMIRTIKAGDLKCPKSTPICELCKYYDFCAKLAQAVKEARKMLQAEGFDIDEILKEQT